VGLAGMIVAHTERTPDSRSVEAPIPVNVIRFFIVPNQTLLGDVNDVGCMTSGLR